MRFYITKACVDKVKNSFLNIRSFYIINTQEIAEGFNSVKNDTYFSFFVNNEIRSRMSDAVLKKKYSNIIYVNNDLTSNAIENLRESLKELVSIDKVIFIDENVDENKELYSLFDEVIFFPSSKRIKIIECECIKNPLFYWVNNKPIPAELQH